MFTLKEERAFIAAQYLHFYKVKTGEPVELFASRMHALEMSLIISAGAPALPETTIFNYTEGKIKND